MGQDFVEALRRALGFTCEFPVNAKGKRVRTNPWDVRIEGRTFELKTATEDVSSSFQLNHIRHHRAYGALPCIGIAPATVYMGAWSKADVATDKAGHLVSMDKGSSATYKLPKRPDQLRPIADFGDAAIDLLVDLNG